MILKTLALQTISFFLFFHYISACLFANKTFIALHTLDFNNSYLSSNNSLSKMEIWCSIKFVFKMDFYMSCYIHKTKSSAFLILQPKPIKLSTRENFIHKKALLDIWILNAKSVNSTFVLVKLIFCPLSCADHIKGNFIWWISCWSIIHQSTSQPKTCFHCST